MSDNRYSTELNEFTFDGFVFPHQSAEEPLSLCNGQIKPAITNQPGSPTKQHAVFPLVKALLSLMHSHVSYRNTRWLSVRDPK